MALPLGIMPRKSEKIECATLAGVVGIFSLSVYCYFINLISRSYTEEEIGTIMPRQYHVAS